MADGYYSQINHLQHNPNGNSTNLGDQIDYKIFPLSLYAASSIDDLLGTYSELSDTAYLGQQGSSLSAGRFIWKIPDFHIANGVTDQFAIDPQILTITSIPTGYSFQAYKAGVTVTHSVTQ